MAMDPHMNELRPVDALTDPERQQARHEGWGTWRIGEEIPLRGHIFQVAAIDADQLVLTPLRPTRKMLKRLTHA